MEKPNKGAAKEKKGFTASFNFEKATTGAVRFQEANAEGVALTTADGAKIGTLYVRKTAVGDPQPKGAIVEVTFTY